MEIIKQPLNLLWVCLLLHLLADYTLQGCLANLKQKQWWYANIKKEQDKTYAWHDKAWHMYEHDYIAGLLCHSFMWSILTFLPFMWLISPLQFSALIIVHALLHTVIDHLKANMHAINLCQDQYMHLLQIGIAVVAYALMNN